MKSNYKRLGDFIEPCNEFNEGMKVKELLGINNIKFFQKSHTNTIGIDLQTYRIVRKGQFAYNRATTRNGDKISISLREGDDCIVSPSYRVFKVKDENQLLSQYLMMWFRRPEFDRYARYMSHGSAHEFFEWDQMCEVLLPIPDIEKQRELVKEYNTIVNRINLNKQLIQKLEETAQAIYKQWFVDFEFPDENGQPYKSSGGKMEWCEELGKEVPEGWKAKPLKSICSKIGSGATPDGGKENYKQSGISLIRSMNVYDFAFYENDLAYIDESQANELKNVTVEEGDILFNITGVSVARCCMAPKSVLPARVNQHVMIIRINKDLKLSHYVLCLFCSREAKNKLLGISQSGSTREAITKAEIEEYLILDPIQKVKETFDKIIQSVFNALQMRNRSIYNLSKIESVLLSKMSTI